MALCLAIGLLACLGTIFGLQLASKEPTEAPSFVIREIPESVVDGSFRHAEHYSVDPNSRLLLIPHHLVAGREIASLLTSASPKKRILLLSPDHFSIGDHALATTNKAFRWKEQTVRPDLALNKRLLAAFPTAFRVQDNIFEREHGVRGLVPFLTQAWPQASVNVMTVRNDTATSTLQTLSNQLNELLLTDPELLIVITIDFSHELPAYLADLHDAQAIEHLKTRHAEAFRRVEIDSPPLFFLLTKLASQQTAELIVHAETNSLRLMQASTTELGTSHVLMSSRPVKVIAQRSSRFTLFHDPRRFIQSSEDRVYRGYDEVKTVTIPFAAIFVREQTNTDDIWHTIPLRRASNTTWNVVSDTEFAQQKTIRETWQTWAKQSLSDK
jgi:AmmeMemoRadiSam system protein B